MSVHLTLKYSTGKPGRDSTAESVTNLKYDIESSGGYKLIFSQCLLFRSLESEAVNPDISYPLGEGSPRCQRWACLLWLSRVVAMRPIGDWQCCLEIPHCPELGEKPSQPALR